LKVIDIARKKSMQRAFEKDSILFWFTISCLFWLTILPVQMFWLTILPLPSRKPQPDACFDSQFCHCPHGNHNPMLVLTYNFATALTETTTLNLCTLATILLLVSSFQNCELKQEVSTLTTELQRTHEFHGHGKTRNKYTFNRALPIPQIPPSWKKVFFHISRVGLELFRNSDFGANFRFNSKPSFSCESRRQWTKFPVASKYSCNHRRIGLESKPHRVKIPFFCFNSKPSFSFESRRQRIKFPVTSEYSCNHKRVGLESKLHNYGLNTHFIRNG